jgi:FkbM family methyltransferase
MQKIFTATTGRAGSHNLAEVFNRYGKHCLAEHEPPQLLLQQLGQRPPFCALGWFGHESRLARLGRDFQRRYIVTDELLGRGQALEWYDRDETEKLARLAARKLRHIQRIERKGYRHYIESSQYFLRTHCDGLAALIPDLAVIKLTREPLGTAKSYANRKKAMFVQSLPPDRPGNLFRIEDWQGLSPFQLYLHLWIETELRYRVFIERWAIDRRFEIEVHELLDPKRVQAMFDYFGVEHGEIETLNRTNVNPMPTEITPVDVDEFHQLLELAPPALIDRIDYFKSYVPQPTADVHGVRLGRSAGVPRQRHMAAVPRRPFLGSKQLGRVLSDLPMTCLDVGARGGFTRDLLPLAWAVSAFGFEPDAEECARLNGAAAERPGPWRSLRFVPTALSGGGGTRTLYLTRQRGTSSMLKVDPSVGEKFSRGDYYILEGQLEVPTLPLDEAAEKYRFSDAVYMKIDIEGMELEVFRAAPRLMSTLLALRVETGFLDFREGQPTFHDIDTCLREYGFQPMGFMELHHWRRLTKLKHPKVSRGPIPYSRGQLAHGDMLYFRDPDSMPDDSAEAIARLLRMAFLALAYEYVDHAAYILRRPAVAAHLAAAYNGLDLDAALDTVSRSLLDSYRRRRRRQVWIDFKGVVGRRLGILEE